MTSVERTVRVRVITYQHPDGTTRTAIRGEVIRVADPDWFDRAEIAAGFPPLQTREVSGGVAGGNGRRGGAARAKPKQRRG